MRTDRTVANNKPGIKIRVAEKGTYVLTDVAISGDRNVIKKGAEKILNYKDLTFENSAHVECESKIDTSNDRGERNHLRITQTVPEQRTGIARNEVTIENSRTHAQIHTQTNPTESRLLTKVQDDFHGTYQREHRTTDVLYTLETSFVPVMYCKYPA